MDLADTTASRRALRDTPWPAAARTFLGSIRAGGHRPGQLLTVGTPAYEPWHLVAHLADSARVRDEPSLTPTLLRRSIETGAPPHLRMGLEVLERAGRGATVLVVSPSLADAALLERLDDARRRGSTVLALTEQDDELTLLAHDALATSRRAPFEVVSHLVSLGLPTRPTRWPARRARRALETVGV